MSKSVSIKKIKNRIEKIEKLLAEIKKEVDNLDTSPKATNKSRKREKPKFEREKLISDYKELYGKYLKSGPKIVKEFINSNKKVYIEMLCKANNLPIDAHNLSKDNIAKEIIGWMNQARVISSKV